MDRRREQCGGAEKRDKNAKLQTIVSHNLGHVTTEVHDELVGADSVKKNNGGLSTSWVGARWSWGWTPLRLEWQPPAP